MTYFPDGSNSPIVISTEPCNGIQFRWINGEDYLFLTGIREDWTLLRGIVGVAVEEIVRPVGDFIAYDFVP